MKCLAVFSTLPDLLYLWFDEQFQQHLVDTALIQKLPPDLAGDEDDLMQMYATHFFSPIVTSNKYMAEVKNTYKTISCGNGLLFTTRQLSDLFYIAVCGDGDESELFLQRKIHFFNCLLLFHYGPCASSHLKPDSVVSRKERWSSLTRQLLTWHTLCAQEHMFLVEALERLHVNQQLNTISLNLLADAMKVNNKDGKSVHALLLVNNKLLGLYSNERSPDLQVSDILLLIVLVKFRFRYRDETVPKSSYRTPDPLCSESAQLVDDNVLFKGEVGVQVDSDDSILDYVSVASTPLKTDSLLPTGGSGSTQLAFSDEHFEEALSNYDISMNEASLEMVSDSSDDQSTTSTNKNNYYISNSEPSSSICSKEVQDDLEDEPSDFAAPELDEEPEAGSSIQEGHFHETVFLRIRPCRCAPHHIHCLLLDNATVLILISQHSNISLAVSMQLLLDKLQSAISFSSTAESYNDRVQLYENIVKAASKIQYVFTKSPELHTKPLERAFRMFEKRWKTLVDCGLEKFMCENPEDDDFNLPDRIEGCVEACVKSVKTLFTMVFIAPLHGDSGRAERKLKTVMNIRDVAIRKLSHFSCYLQVRGQRNITMTAYHNDFPGLVHFIYINRKVNQLIAPTINVNKDSKNDTKQLPIYVVVKQRIWDYWQYMETMVLKGFTALIVREGDFTYSYFLWFQDTLGKPLTPTKSIKDVRRSTCPSGILSSSFYKDLIAFLFPSESEGMVNCYELFCVHVGVVNNHFVTTSAQKLTHMLFEASGEANSPVNLL